jgi:bifunctional lysine-specific demethylase and histidyl-hydroxylase NO66
MNDYSLEWLLSPLSVEEFVEGPWETEPHLVARDDRSYFRTLFNEADFDSVLEYGQPRPPKLRVVLRGDGPSASEYLQSDGRLDLNQLRKFYAEGHTIAVNGLDDFWGPVASLVQAMQRRLSSRVEVNAYLTPRGSQALRPHYDSHDVIVVQIGGVKVWRLYRSDVRYPLHGSISPSPFSRDELPEPRVVEVAAGDVMYVPRGWIHEAETADVSSLHLTVGIYPPLWRDFIAKTLDALTLRHEGLRRALPVGYLNDPQAIQTLSSELADLAGVLEREGSAAEALGMLQDDFVRLGRSGPDGQFVAALDRLSSIDLSARLAKRSQLYSRVVDMGSSVAIQFSRSLVQGPKEYSEAMVFVVQNEGSFLVSDLPGLADDEKVSFAQQLVRDGFLAFV